MCRCARSIALASFLRRVAPVRMDIPLPVRSSTSRNLRDSNDDRAAAVLRSPTLFSHLAEQSVVDVAVLSIFELLAENVEIVRIGNEIQRAQDTTELVFRTGAGECLALSMINDEGK